MARARCQFWTLCFVVGSAFFQAQVVQAETQVIRSDGQKSLYSIATCNLENLWDQSP